LFRDLLPGNGTVNVAVQSNGGRAAATPEDEVSELAELRPLAETLRQSVRARDDFIAIAAHELRNPMTPIVGVAELALIAARKDGECVKLRQRPDGLFRYARAGSAERSPCLSLPLPRFGSATSRFRAEFPPARIRS
jgi:signal transduction histidine kinase